MYHPATGPHQGPRPVAMPLPRGRGHAVRKPHVAPKIAPVSRPYHAPSRPSLYRSGLAARLALAVGMSGLVWLAIAWALTL